MHDVLITNWNNKISKSDSVYILGDVSFGKAGKTSEVLNQLNGKKFLIVGNHDTQKYIGDESFCSCFEWMKLYHTEKIYNKIIIMMHFPFLTWDRQHYGSIHLHGHTHSVNKDKLDCLRFDVGIDGAEDFAPYEMESLLQEIENRRIL